MRAGIRVSLLRAYMQFSDYEYLYNLEEDFWWFAGMREITRTMLQPDLQIWNDERRRARILDAGCGTGGMLNWFKENTAARLYGIDIVPDALRFAATRQPFQLAQASATHLPFALNVFDAVMSFDVLVQLPHAEAPAQALREMHRVLRPDGLAFVRVAAYEWMRSGHDRALSTAHRFNLPTLERMMEQSGFRIVRASYANMWLLPAAIIHRLILKRLNIVNSGSDVKPLAPRLQWLNPMLQSVLHAEARLLRQRNMRLPFGLSAIAIGRKATP